MKTRNNTTKEKMKLEKNKINMRMEKKEKLMRNVGFNFLGQSLI